MLATIYRIDHAIATLEMAVVIACTSAVTLIMIAQVFMRYFLNSPLFWAEEISVQLLVFTTLFGLSLLVYKGALVAIDFLPRALSRRSQSALYVLLGLIALALFAFFSYMGWVWISRPEVRLELIATTQLPKWYKYSVLPISMGLMAWHQLVQVLRHTKALITGVPA